MRFGCATVRFEQAFQLWESPTAKLSLPQVFLLIHEPVSSCCR
jgi:hypothetical protein